jgi:hypothetical protein
LATYEKGGFVSPDSYLDNAKHRQSLASTAPLNWPTITFLTAFHGIAGLAPWFFFWPALGVPIFLHDPYSAKRGFWWSHCLWLIHRTDHVFNYERYKKYAPDLDRDPFYRGLNRYFLLLQIPLGLLLYLLGGWPFVIYGIFVRTVVLWHSTWLINSAAHLVGYRTFDTPIILVIFGGRPC